MDDNSATDSPKSKNFGSHPELEFDTEDDLWNVDTRDREAGPDGHPVKLADWSAQDFASIYTRFRPHLERHARRFLNNPSQVDEVVQDAFLYLMVSLPELDSEIGVLRFLKWKTRLLCLDVIRASGKAYVANIDDVAEPMSSDPEVSSYLEQQDDAAVLRLALSKLNPRHREVLLASIYEEKSTEQIAAQVGLSENATRQLIFRARSAFKKALLGDDVNTDGMSAAAILSVAARKAAQEAKKVGAQAMVFVLFLMLAIGAFVNFTGRGNQTQQLAESQAPAAPTKTQNPESGESVQVTSEATAGTPIVAAPVSDSKPSASPSPSPSADLLEDTYRSVNTAFVQKSQIISSSFYPADSRQALVLKGETLGADFELSIATKHISSLRLRLEVDDEVYKMFPTDYQVFEDTPGILTIIGKLGYFVDTSARLVRDNPLQSATFIIYLKIDTSGTAYSAEIRLKN